MSIPAQIPTLAKLASEAFLFSQKGKRLDYGVDSDRINGLFQAQEQDTLNAQQCFLLGWLYSNSDRRLFPLAIPYFKRAALEDHPQAIFNLAKIFELGIGVEKDINKAVELLRRAIRRDFYGKAWAALGWIYDHHEPMRRSRQIIEQCYKEAYSSGHLPSATTLAFFYLSHYAGEERNRKLLDISRYLQTAEERGHIGATYIIGLMHHYGIGSDVDRERAIECFRRGAEKLHQPSIKALIELFGPDSQFPDEEVQQHYLEIYRSAASREARADLSDPIEKYRKFQAHICIGEYEFIDSRHFIAAVLRNSALTHREFGALFRSLPSSEHMEFTGDRILNMAVTRELTKIFADKSRGELDSRYQKFTRNADASHRYGSALYRVAKEIDLKSLLIMSDGDSLHRMRKRGRHQSKKTLETQLANHVEMLIEAIAQDKTPKEAEEFVLRYWRRMGLNPDEQSDDEFGLSDDEADPHAPRALGGGAGASAF